MSIARINQFRAKPDKGGAVWDLLQSVVSMIAESPGCEMFMLLRQEDDPDRCAVVEIWKDKASHKAAAARIPPDVVANAMELLDFRPHADFYTMYVPGPEA